MLQTERKERGKQINLKEYLTVLKKSWQELGSYRLESTTYDLTSGKENTEEWNAFMGSLACLWFIFITV